MSSALDSCPALVLNADFRPLNYFPLSLWGWQDTVKAVFLDRVNVVSEYDNAIHSPSWEMKLPSVISLKQYVQVSRKPAFTRFNVFLRDRFSCQYCSDPFPTQDLTFDHVVPRSRGGRTEWTNVVTACGICNLKKGNKSIKEAHMHLLKKPDQPNNHYLQKVGRAFPPNYLHKSWRDFLYWDSELETS
ncbi:MAG TPA: HNH endonuclease [Rhodospirillales bacterium]|nr:HNH endonuclease [Rhodospirillales bacterium]